MGIDMGRVGSCLLSVLLPLCRERLSEPWVWLELSWSLLLYAILIAREGNLERKSIIRLQNQGPSFLKKKHKQTKQILLLTSSWEKTRDSFEKISSNSVEMANLFEWYRVSLACIMFVVRMCLFMLNARTSYPFSTILVLALNGCMYSLHSIPFVKTWQMPGFERVEWRGF